MTQEAHHFVLLSEGSRLLGKVQGWVLEPSGAFQGWGGGRQESCHFNSQPLCKSAEHPPSPISSVGSTALNSKQSFCTSASWLNIA